METESNTDDLDGVNELNSYVDTPDDLSHWENCEHLNFFDAVCLALGKNPHCFCLLVEETKENPQHPYHSIKGFDKLANALDHSSVKRLPSGPHEGLINVDSFVTWLEKHNIDAPFFSNEAPIPKPVKRPEYSTHMIKIMYDVIERYYGENYDPNNRDSVSSGPAVQKWITENYERSDGSGEPVSGVEARAIDTMTRPDDIRRPKTKKC